MKIMNKKTLGIILAVLAVAIAGMVFFGSKKDFFTGEGKGIGEAGRKSIMDAAREQGQIAPSKTDAAKECEKSTEQGDKDMCYGMMAFYYRDVSFCKLVKDAEIKEKCNKENIEEWYNNAGKGAAASLFMPGGLIPGGAGGGIEGVGNIKNAEPENIPSDASGQSGQIIEPSGNMTDEIYIEVLAKSSYYAQKSPELFASRIKALYEQYGITEEDVSAYGEELNEDPQNAGEIGLRYLQRAQELQAIGE